MIEGAEELVEAVDGGQELVAVAQVVLAELARRIALLLEESRDRHVPGLEALLVAPGMPTLLKPVRTVLWPVMKDERPAVQL